MKYFKIAMTIVFSLIQVSQFSFSASDESVGVFSVKMNETISTIHSRKSVRLYWGGQVSKEELTTIVKAGMAAPTAMDKRLWAFIIVTDDATLARLAEGLRYSGRNGEPEARPNFEDGLEDFLLR